MIVGFAKLSPVQEETCLDCDPPIPDTLYVTFADLQGAFATYNSKHELMWVTDCQWGTAKLNLRAKEAPDTALIEIRVNATCRIVFSAGEQGCEPWTFTWTYLICNSAGCPGTSCPFNQANATCVVSLT